MDAPTFDLEAAKSAAPSIDVSTPEVKVHTELEVETPKLKVEAPKLEVEAQKLKVEMIWVIWPFCSFGLRKTFIRLYQTSQKIIIESLRDVTVGWSGG